MASRSDAQRAIPRGSSTRWFSTYTDVTRLLEHQHQVLERIGLLVEYVARDSNVNTQQRLEFAYRLRLCFVSAGINVWPELEHLISWARDEWAADHALRRALTASAAVGEGMPIPIHDLLHDAEYVNACRASANSEAGEDSDSDIPDLELLAPEM
ncbi:hypothetical protein QCA50_014847 [Cerrena zonata]|uniref:Uncharacterized protein n=1 Tax=Cerrena zonata TaxID=2478898 RepID=A0AAW0FKD5_9APHY